MVLSLITNLKEDVCIIHSMIRSIKTSGYVISRVSRLRNFLKEPGSSLPAVVLGCAALVAQLSGGLIIGIDSCVLLHGHPLNCCRPFGTHATVPVYSQYVLFSPA